MSEVRDILSRNLYSAFKPPATSEIADEIYILRVEIYLIACERERERDLIRREKKNETNGGKEIFLFLSSLLDRNLEILSLRGITYVSTVSSLKVTQYDTICNSAEITE